MHSHHQQGFGLLEVLVSGALVVLVVGGSVGLMRTSLRRADAAADRVVAMHLANEGLEAVRHLRDTSYVDGSANAWHAYIPLSGPGCGSGSSAASLRLATGSGGQLSLVQGLDQGLGGGRFSREICVSVPSGYANRASLSGITDTDVVRKVMVVVRWGSGALEQVQTEALLMDWRRGV